MPVVSGTNPVIPMDGVYAGCVWNELGVLVTVVNNRTWLSGDRYLRYLGTVYLLKMLCYLGTVNLLNMLC